MQSELAIELRGELGSDSEELAELTSRLRRELLSLEVEAVEPVTAGQPAEGAKGVEALAIGTLIVQFASSVECLRNLVSGCRAWLRRQRARSIKLTIDGDTCEVTGLDSTEQQRLIDLWITRHAGA